MKPRIENIIAHVVCTPVEGAMLMLEKYITMGEQDKKRYLELIFGVIGITESEETTVSEAIRYVDENLAETNTHLPHKKFLQCAAAWEQLKADYENDPVEHAKRLIEKSAEKGIKEFRNYCAECTAFLAGLPAEERDRVTSALAEYYDEPPHKTAQDGQRAAAGISPTSAEKRQEIPFTAPETADNDQEETSVKIIELFNVQESGKIFISKAERDAHPNAEYFTAEVSPEHVGEVLEGWGHSEPNEVKSLKLTFRKPVTVKGGEIADVAKSGETFKAVAVEDGGKLFLRFGAAAMGENIVGLLVRNSISLKGAKE